MSSQIFDLVGFYVPVVNYIDITVSVHTINLYKNAIFVYKCNPAVDLPLLRNEINTP